MCGGRCRHRGPRVWLQMNPQGECVPAWRHARQLPLTDVLKKYFAAAAMSESAGTMLGRDADGSLMWFVILTLGLSLLFAAVSTSYGA